MRKNKHLCNKLSALSMLQRAQLCRRAALSFPNSISSEQQSCQGCESPIQVSVFHTNHAQLVPRIPFDVCLEE